MVYYVNVSVVYLSINLVQHQRTKHVEIDLHFIHECVVVRDVRVLHVPTTSQFVDIFIKGLPSSEFRSPSQRVSTGGGRELIVLGAHKLRVLGGLGPLCGGRSNLAYKYVLIISPN
jgi:hypothetical protein